MRYKSRVIAVALLALGLVGMMLAGTASATPTYEPPVIHWVSSPVHAYSNGTAEVRGRYTCWGGNANTHLFIAIKQGPRVNATTHTSSSYAKTFYSTNWNSDGPGLSLNCNGKEQHGRFTLKPDPYWAEAGNNPPPLKNGAAFVQFCLFDSTNTGESDPNGFALDYAMNTVQLQGH